VKASLKDLWNARATLGKLAGMSFKAKTAYKLMKLIDQVNKEIEPFGKVRQELFQKYGEQEGDRVTIKPENIEIFSKELEELESQEIELKYTVNLDEIGEAQLSPSELYDLDFMFKEDMAIPQ